MHHRSLRPPRGGHIHGHSQCSRTDRILSVPTPSVVDGVLFGEGAGCPGGQDAVIVADGGVPTEFDPLHGDHANSSCTRPECQSDGRMTWAKGSALFHSS